MINIKSIKRKDEILSEVIKDENLYVLFVTETWLKWNKATCNQMDNNYDLHCVGRPCEHRGGGLALNTKKECKAKLFLGGIIRTFEYGLWELTSGKSNIMLLGIYHLPPSNRNVHTNENFIDEFLELFMDLSKKYIDLLIMGNFDIHYYCDYDIIGEQFHDSMEAIGLIQHMNFEMHTSGNIIYLVLTEQLIKFKVTKVREGPMLLDHKMVIWNLNIGKPDTQSI